MDNVFQQCRELYNAAFGDDGSFGDMLFGLFSKDLRYITEERVICMAFCIDVFADGKKGKYLYGVATDENYRSKGYMSRLFSKIEDEFKEEYDFLCLHPASESLIKLYNKKGFALNLSKSVTEPDCKPLILIENEKELKAVLLKVLPENSITYSEDYLKLLLLYANAFCDNKDNPKKLCIEQKNGGILEYFCKENTKTAFNSMSKPLKNININNSYFAITLE